MSNDHIMYFVIPICVTGRAYEDERQIEPGKEKS